MILPQVIVSLCEIEFFASMRMILTLQTPHLLPLPLDYGPLRIFSSDFEFIQGQTAAYRIFKTLSSNSSVLNLLIIK